MKSPQRSVERIQNVSGGVLSAMSLAQLSDWCAHRFGKHEVATDPLPRPFDLPWMVLDSSKAIQQWDWRPTVPVEEILNEIAAHARLHPDWLEICVTL